MNTNDDCIFKTVTFNNEITPKQRKHSLPSFASPLILSALPVIINKKLNNIQKCNYQL
jgi:hypothetical protein